MAAYALNQIPHIVPLNDDMQHSTTSPCNCFPRVVSQDGVPVRIEHNAWDGRERTEALK